MLLRIRSWAFLLPVWNLLPNRNHSGIDTARKGGLGVLASMVGVRSGKSECVSRILRCNATSLYYVTAAYDRGGHRKRLTSGASLSHNPRIVSTTPTRTTIFSYPSSCTTTSASPSSLATEVSDSAVVTPRSALSKSAESVGGEAVVEAGGGVVLAVIANIVSCSINIIKSIESNLSRLIGPSTKGVNWKS